MTDRWAAVTTLTDPSRRALYDYVRRQDHPVPREEAADATAMSRGLAAFHLDKLVEAGLLAAHYQAPAGRPRRRGRAPKVYLPAGDGLTLTIPERRYELVADILAEAVETPGAPADETATAVAYRRGRTVGAGLPPGDLVDVLAGLGFEPQHRDGMTVLHNCPFHTLALRHTTLVCGLNHAFLTGLLDGLGAVDSEAVLAPQPPACCVQVRARPAT